MKKLFWAISFFVFSASSNGQGAMDFSMTDCNDNMHHLFADYLDNEEVVIIEYFMSCTSCIQVGQKITPMFNQLSIDYPGQVNFFAFNFLDDFDCTVATDFVTLNSINAVPFDSGGTQLAYYGGFGMPSVVIVGGSQHEVIYFSKTIAGTNDTAAMDSAIRNFFTTMDIVSEADNLSFSVYPNPSSDFIQLKFSNDDFIKGELEITNLTGQEIYHQKIISHNEMLDIRAFPKGVYFLSLTGNKVHRSTKIIVL